MSVNQVLELVEDKLRLYESKGLREVELECRDSKTYTAIISQRTIIGWEVQKVIGKHTIRFVRLK